LISSEPSFLPTMMCSTQRQCISCCFLILSHPSKELLLHSELIRTSWLCRNQVLCSYWLLNLDFMCCCLRQLTTAQLSFHWRERHKRCSLGQQEPS